MKTLSQLSAEILRYFPECEPAPILRALGHVDELVDVYGNHHIRNLVSRVLSSDIVWDTPKTRQLQKELQGYLE